MCVLLLQYFCYGKQFYSRKWFMSTCVKLATVALLSFIMVTVAMVGHFWLVVLETSMVCLCIWVRVYGCHPGTSCHCVYRLGLYMFTCVCSWYDHSCRLWYSSILPIINFTKYIFETLSITGNLSTFVRIAGVIYLFN